MSVSNIVSAQRCATSCVDRGAVGVCVLGSRGRSRSVMDDDDTMQGSVSTEGISVGDKLDVHIAIVVGSL